MGNYDVAQLVFHGCEWAGCVLGLSGAWLLASNTRVSKYGWIAFLLANFAMIAFAVGVNAYGLLLQQVGFTGSSLLGLYRSGLWPWKRGV